jgi:hypothetical protein
MTIHFFPSFFFLFNFAVFGNLGRIVWNFRLGGQAERLQGDAFAGQGVAVGSVAVAVAGSANWTQWTLLTSVVSKSAVFTGVTIISFRAPMKFKNIALKI